MEDLFKIFPALLEKLEGDDELREKLVFAAWRRIAGDELGSRTVAVALEEKRLIVAVENDNWKKNLVSLTPQMIFRLNGALGQSQVSFIEFITDEEKVRLERLRNSDFEDENEELKKAARGEITDELLHSAETIEDITLREKFLAAAGTALARKKKFIKK